MKPDEIHFADSAEILKRKAALDRFTRTLFEADLQPWFVSDEATIFDISGDTIEEIMDKIRKCYGIELTRQHLSMPVWKLLDLLERQSEQ
jgi:hypothetical protein